MKNYEKYREPLLEHLLRGDFFGVSNGKIKSCEGHPCYGCDFNEPNNRSCSDARRAWLYEDASSTLTSDERKLCELLRTGYIAQDATENGEIYYYPEQQPSLNCAGCWDVVGVYAQLDNIFNVSFKGVNDIKTKAWRVEDLLTLEVCD